MVEGWGGELRVGRLLELRGRREGTLPWVDAGMDRGCYMEALRPRKCGDLGGGESVARAVRLIL